MSMDVDILDADGAFLSTLQTFSNLDAAPGYTAHTLDLTRYRASTYQVAFKVWEDPDYATSFVLTT
jgi:hypothetical protein